MTLKGADDTQELTHLTVVVPTAKASPAVESAASNVSVETALSAEQLFGTDFTSEEVVVDRYAQLEDATQRAAAAKARAANSVQG